VAERIRRDGGTAHVARQDLLDRPAVERHAAAVGDSAGGIDVCFNADVQGTPLADMEFDDFLRPVTKSVSTSPRPHSPGSAGSSPPSSGRTASASPGCCRPAHPAPTKPARTTATPPAATAVPTASCSTAARATTTSPMSPSSPLLIGPAP
jgi:hypothetical protein